MSKIYSNLANVIRNFRQLTYWRLLEDFQAWSNQTRQNDIGILFLQRDCEIGPLSTHNLVSRKTSSSWHKWNNFQILWEVHYINFWEKSSALHLWSFYTFLSHFHQFWSLAMVTVPTKWEMLFLKKSLELFSAFSTLCTAQNENQGITTK